MTSELLLDTALILDEIGRKATDSLFIGGVSAMVSAQSDLVNLAGTFFGNTIAGPGNILSAMNDMSNMFFTFITSQMAVNELGNIRWIDNQNLPDVDFFKKYKIIPMARQAPLYSIRRYLPITHDILPSDVYMCVFGANLTTVSIPISLRVTPECVYGRTALTRAAILASVVGVGAVSVCYPTDCANFVMDLVYSRNSVLLSCSMLAVDLDI